MSMVKIPSLEMDFPSSQPPLDLCADKIQEKKKKLTCIVQIFSGDSLVPSPPEQSLGSGVRG